MKIVVAAVAVLAIAGCSSEPPSLFGQTPATVTGSTGGVDTEVPRVANGQHLWDHTSPEGVVTAADVGDVTFGVHFANGSPTSPPCRVPCATSLGLLVTYRLPDGRTGEVPFVEPVPLNGSSTTGSNPHGDVYVVASIGLSSDRDGPTAVAAKVSGNVAKVTVDLAGGGHDEVNAVAGWVAFVATHGMSNLRAFDRDGHVIVECAPVQRAPGCT